MSAIDPLIDRLASLVPDDARLAIRCALASSGLLGRVLAAHIERDSVAREVIREGLRQMAANAAPLLGTDRLLLIAVAKVQKQEIERMLRGVGDVEVMRPLLERMHEAGMEAYKQAVAAEVARMMEGR